MIDKTVEEFRAWNLKKTTWQLFEALRSKDQIQDDVAVMLYNIAIEEIRKAELLDRQFREKYPKGKPVVDGEPKK